MRLYQSQNFKTMFEISRNLPNVLKLFCFGSKDTIFEENLLAEKSIYYSYKKALEPSYEKKMKTRYEKLFGKKVENIQERFVFNFEGAGHSLHRQKRFNDQIQKIIGDYVEMIIEE